MSLIDDFLTNSKAAQNTTDQEHGNMCCSSLQGTSYDGDRSSNKESLFATQIVARPAIEQCAEQTTDREAAVHGTDDTIGIGISWFGRNLSEVEVFEPRRLSKSG